MYILESGELAETLLFVGEPGKVELQFPSKKSFLRAVAIAHAQWEGGAQYESAYNRANRPKNN
jgi:hypothetical protein